jgi:hypothetical protein
MVAPVCLLAGTSTAFAQIPNDFIGTLGIPRSATVQAATRSEWNKISPSEIGCIDGVLRKRGASIETLTQRGVKPSDPRLGSIRSNCRSQLAQQSRSEPTYAVAGLALGSRVQFDSSDYREYKCSPSEQFAEFTWCQKTRQERDRRASTTATYSILHSQDGTVVYANRYQEPAVFGPNEVDEAIRQNSIKIGEKAKIDRLPRRPGFPEGTLATWGKVVLEPLDNDSIKTLAEGRSPKKGYLIDFIGNFARSAKEGLSIYRISGGAGFLWVASYDQRGRGTLRFATIDPSAIHSIPLPREAQRSDPQSKPQDAEPPSAERVNVGADVARRDVAIQEADKAIEKTKTDTDVAREGSETTKRDAQLAKTEIERLNADGAKLTAALERLETEKTAAEAKVHTMESVAYGGIAISIALLAIVSSVLFVNRRKATAAKREGIETETKPPEVTGDFAVVETRRTLEDGDSHPSKARDTASSAPELAQSSVSDANIGRSRDESDVSKSKAGSDAAEEYVTLPI